MTTLESMEVECDASLYPLGQDNASFPDVLKCIFGCVIDHEKEVIPLSCFHFLCSESCAKKLEPLSKPGLFSCNLCRTVIPEEELKRRIILANLFVKKPDMRLLKCEYCIFDNLAIAFCSECSFCLCEKCKDMHPQLRNSKDHVVDDLTEDKRAELLEKRKNTENKCRDHLGETLSSFCENCDEKICQKCEGAHEGHDTFHIETERTKLLGKVDMTRNVIEGMQRAVEEISRKHSEIMNTEWKKISDDIQAEFAELAAVLGERAKELQTELKKQFVEQLAALNMRKKCAQLQKQKCEEFIEIAENVLNNGADIAPIKFSRQYEDLMEKLGKMNTEFVRNYNRFVGKDFHFQVDISADAGAKEYLWKCCQVEYRNVPASVPEAPRENSSCAPSNPSEEESFGNTTHSGLSNPKSILWPDFPEAPVNSFNFFQNTQGNKESKTSCIICSEADHETTSCCIKCGNRFHNNCHAPVIENVQLDKWVCYLCRPMQDIEAVMTLLPQINGSENFKACKFVMESHRIPQSNILGWVFVSNYFNGSGKMPYHLNYIRERISPGRPEPFSGVDEMMQAFRQMFLQAFLIYKDKKEKYKNRAKECFQKFLELVKEFYPEEQDVFSDVLCTLHN